MSNVIQIGSARRRLKSLPRVPTTVRAEGKSKRTAMYDYYRTTQTAFLQLQRLMRHTRSVAGNPKVKGSLKTLLRLLPAMLAELEHLKVDLESAMKDNELAQALQEASARRARTQSAKHLTPVAPVPEKSREGEET